MFQGSGFSQGRSHKLICCVDLDPNGAACLNCGRALTCTDLKTILAMYLKCTDRGGVYKAPEGLISHIP